MRITSFFYFLFFVYFDIGFLLYSLGCPGTNSVDQAGLELRNLPASVSQVVGLKACNTREFLNLINNQVPGNKINSNKSEIFSTQKINRLRMKLV